jgi:hypothetical protein
VSVRVRFAPSPTGSLHVGNALTAVANRRFADERGGVLILRSDDTDPSRVVEGGEKAILQDLGWLGVPFEEGPVRQSERGDLTPGRGGHSPRALRPSRRLGAARRRPDPLPGGRHATYQLAPVTTTQLRITHVIAAGPPPNLEVQQRIARPSGASSRGDPPHRVGPDGKKLEAARPSSIAELRDEGISAGPCAPPRRASRPSTSTSTSPARPPRGDRGDETRSRRGARSATRCRPARRPTLVEARARRARRSIELEPPASAQPTTVRRARAPARTGFPATTPTRSCAS